VNESLSPTPSAPAGDGRGHAAGFLARVCTEADERVAVAARAEPLAAQCARARATPPPPPFGAALRGGIIAEVKRASPSRGVIAAGRDAVAQARAYTAGGAAAVSVLTEPAHCHGDLADLTAVAGATDLPLLRKDFVRSAYQLFEARAAGAAAALLLVAALDAGRLEELIGVADEAGIEVLIETHDATEVARATAVLAGVDSRRPPVVGVNARDLTRLSVDRSVFADLVDGLPDGAIVVAECGVTGPADVEDYIRHGADAVLVGEHLMLATDPAAATRALVDAAQQARRTSVRSDPT
jgi:indole-3-glycerol phosphate synthase